MAAHPTIGREPWNKGKLVGQKAPFKLKEIWAIRIRLQLAQRKRELALFNLAIDSKLRACDLVKLRVRDVCHADRVSARAIVMQQKTQRSVQFETSPTREEQRSPSGSSCRGCDQTTSCFLAAHHAQRISRLVSITRFDTMTSTRRLPMNVSASGLSRPLAVVTGASSGIGYEALATNWRAN
jgi:hypothetical protein